MRVDGVVVDRFDVVDDLRLEEEERRRAVRGARVGEEVRIAGGDDPVDHELAGATVIGVQAVLLPRVVPEDDVGADRADQLAHAVDAGGVGLELAVDRAEEVHIVGAEGAAAARCSSLTGGDQRGEVSVAGSQVPFEPSVSTSELDVGAGARPFRERRAAPELDVVGMGTDGEDRARGARCR